MPIDCIKTVTKIKFNQKLSIRCVGQFWSNVTVRQYFADIIGLFLTTVTKSA